MCKKHENIQKNNDEKKSDANIKNQVIFLKSNDIFF